MRGLVVFQVVVTCVLLTGSLLQMQSIRKQQTIDYGYNTEGIMSARMGLMDGAYPSQEMRKNFFDRLVRELGTHPEFQSVALTNKFRMVFSGSGAIEIEGKTYKEKSDRPNANFEQVTPGYFEVTGQTMMEGRGFQEDDLDALPVAIRTLPSRASTSATRARWPAASAPWTATRCNLDPGAPSSGW
jgi:hypothetical protein